jgi:hypothetical protein
MLPAFTPESLSFALPGLLLLLLLLRLLLLFLFQVALSCKEAIIASCKATSS